MQLNHHNKIGSGLYNLGNTCFFNAVMQVILHTSSLAKELQAKSHSNGAQCPRQKGWCILCKMEKLYSQSKTQRVASPNDIVQHLKTIFKKYRLGRQEDSHQFLRYLVQGMQEAETGKIVFSSKDQLKNEHKIIKSLTFRIFGGIMRTFVKCQSCHHRSLSSQRYYDLNIECQKSNSLQEGLSNFFRVDHLEGHNKYKCSHCKQLSNAQKGLSILTVPNVLTFQMKRFTNTLRKINKTITYPKQLEIGKYIDKDIHQHYYKNTDAENHQENHSQKLELFAIVVHSGRYSFSGHYYSFVKSGKDWYEMNDSNVSKVSEERAMNQQAYLLFYRRCQNLTTNNEIVKNLHLNRILQAMKQEQGEPQQNGNERTAKSLPAKKQTALQKKQRKNSVQNNKRKKSMEENQEERKKKVKKDLKNQEKQQKEDEHYEETKRKLSMDIQQLIKQAKKDTHQDKGGKNFIEINGKRIQAQVFGQSINNVPAKQQNQRKIYSDIDQSDEDGDDSDFEIQLPKLVKRKSKEQMLSEMGLLEMVLKYSNELLLLSKKLPSRGNGHRMMRPVYNLRKYEMAMKRRKLG